MSPSPGEVGGCSWDPVASHDIYHMMESMLMPAPSMQEYLPIVTHLM